MNKQAARKKAESETLSIGELRSMLAAAPRNGMSRVNPSLTMTQVIDIHTAALAGRDDNEVPKAWRSDPYSSTGATKPTRDVLIITNILRDCA